MKNLLLITDMARLGKVFEQLADTGQYSVRIVNNLENGGEEVAAEKPDVIFVQTHLSGLSAEILHIHLKKKLGRKRSRFVLLATPGQVSKEILKPYQGWIDISCPEAELLPAIQNLLRALYLKTAISVDNPQAIKKNIFAPDVNVQVKNNETSPLINSSTPADTLSQTQTVQETANILPAVINTSFEDQVGTYPPRPRLSVYSEFNSSFDSAVNNTPEPERPFIKKDKFEQNWDEEIVNSIDKVQPRSRISTFLLWLVPVVIAVVIVTFLQKERTSPVTKDMATHQVIQPLPKQPGKSAESVSTGQAAQTGQNSGLSDNAVITAIAENRASMGTTAVTPQSASDRPSELPDFIPRYGLDKQYGLENPGWERYKGQVTEFKIFREGQSIKAIQVIDRGGMGVPESFMKGVLRQVAKKPVLSVETAEKKDGYEIQRGQVSENLKAVYYRDEQGGKLRAFVMTWK